jgi:hypothetical protein
VILLYVLKTIIRSQEPRQTADCALCADERQEAAGEIMRMQKFEVGGEKYQGTYQKSGSEEVGRKRERRNVSPYRNRSSRD